MYFDVNHHMLLHFQVHVIVQFKQHSKKRFSDIAWCLGVHTMFCRMGKFFYITPMAGILLKQKELRCKCWHANTGVSVYNICIIVCIRIIVLIMTYIIMDKRWNSGLIGGSNSYRNSTLGLKKIRWRQTNMHGSNIAMVYRKCLNIRFRFFVFVS